LTPTAEEMTPAAAEVAAEDPSVAYGVAAAVAVCNY
jgi:hypothetical protein